MLYLRVIVLSALCAAPVFAQPYINYRGVVNAASYAPPGVPAGSIARGSIFTIFGRNLGPAQFATPAAFPLASELAGVSVEITQGAVTKAAIPIFSWNNQVSAVMPSDAPLGQVTVRLRFGTQRSNPAQINVVASSIGIFSLTSSGSGPGVVQNFVTQADQPINTSRATARPGQTLLLWGTGLGAVAHADNVSPTQVDLTAANAEIFVGGKLAPRRYAGRSSCCAGLDLIVFDVPADSPEGCFVPVQVRTNRSVVSNSVTIAVERQGQPCTDPFNPVSAALRAGGRIAIGLPTRTAVTLDETDGSVARFTVDRFLGAIRQLPANATYFDPASSLPPLGSCTTYNAQSGGEPGNFFQALPGSQHAPGATLLLGNGAASRTVGPSAVTPALVSALLGKQPGEAGAPALFLNHPATFSLAFAASSILGALETRFDSVAPLQWLGMDAASTVTRSAGLTIRWTGGDPATEIALITGASDDAATNSSGIFVCTAPVSAGAFSVPVEILSTLPASPARSVSSPAWLDVAAARVQQPWRASSAGLDALFMIPNSVALRSVVVK